MLSIELQILKIEGFEQGTTCRVLIDNDEVFIKNSYFKITRHGIITLELIKDQYIQGGVLFSSNLLINASYQYIPIFSPAVYIDNFPLDIGPPRILLIQTSPNLDISPSSSRCETYPLEESLDNTKTNRSDALEKQNFGLKIDLDYLKKRILNEKNIQNAKLEDFQTFIETTNLKNSMIIKNKDFIIKDLQNQNAKIDNLYEKNIENQELFNILYKKIEDDSQIIGGLITTKNELLIKIKELEQENKNIKNNYLKQEMKLKMIELKENALRKEIDTKRVFEKLVEGRMSDKLLEKNFILKSKLEEYQQETLSFKEKYENTETSYKILKGCLLGNDFNEG